MFKFSYKKIISILCSLLIIVSSFISAFTFANADAEVITQNFEENFTFSGNGFELYTATDANDTNVKDGSNSLKWTAKGGSNPISLYPGKDLIVGQSYKIEIWIKAVTSAGSGIDITQLGAKTNGWAYQGNPQISLPYFGTTYDAVGQWKKFEYTFVAEKTVMGLLIYGSDDFYFDSITWTPVKSEVTVNVVTNTETTVEPLKGAPGASLTLPTLTNQDYDFDGWYLDAQFTTPFNGNTYPSEDITIYARWIPEGVILQEFEVNYNYSGAGFSLYTAADENDTNVRSGKKSLKWTHTSGSKAISLYPGKDLTIGQTYKMEVWIKAATSTSSHIDFTQITDVTNGWSFTSQRLALPHFGTNYDSVGQWKKFEVTFTAEKAAMGILLYGSDDFYFDDITWTPVKSEVNVNIVANNGEEVPALTGAPNAPMELPDLTNEGLSFAGWYLDSDLKTPLTNTSTYPTEDITIYARWIPEGVILQEFEINYNYSGAGFSLYTATDENDTNVKDGAKSLKWTAKSGSNPISLYPGKDLTVGETYRLEMWVKAETSTYAHVDITQLNDVANGWSFSDNKRIELPHFGTDYDSVGQWKKFEYTFVADKKAMGLLVYGDDNLYFDSIKWTPIKEKVTVDIVSNNGEEVPSLMGATGLAMDLPVLTKAGFSFAGWYVDEQFKTPFTNITTYPSENVTIYAKWLPEGVVVQDFEANYNYSGSGFSLYTATDENDTNVKDGSKSLKWTNKDGSNAISLYPGKDLTVGETYRFEMWVKAESSTYAHIDITQLNDVNNGWSYAENTRIVFPHFGTDYDSVGKWKKFEYVFVAEKSAMGILIYGDDDFYFDSISWTTVKQDIVVNVVTNNGTEYDALQGATGMELKLPTLTKDGYYFAGWFKNAEFTKPLNSNVFPEESVTVYAKWIENGLITQNFESYDLELVEDSGFKLYTATNKNDTNVYDGEHSLYRKNISRTRVATISDQYTTLTVGKAYKLTFKIKVVELGEGGGGIQFTDLSVRSNPWSYSKFSGITYIGEDYKSLNEWVEVSYIFIAEKSFYGLASYGNIAYYVDDFKLVEIPITTISFETGDGEAKASQSGAAGSNLSIENPVPPEGKSFAGWYLDKDYTEPFVVSLYPETDIVLYARWIEQGTFEQDFELWPGDGAFGTSPVFKLYTATDENDPNVYSGKHSMLYSNQDKNNTFALNIFDTTMGELKIGEKYNVSIRFKPVSTPYDKYAQNGTYHSIYNTTLQSNCWTYQSQGPQAKYRSYVFYQTEFSDEYWTGTGNAVTTTKKKDANGWLTMNYEITATTPFIALYMTGFYSMYIDYITIIPLESGVVKENYSLPYTEEYYDILNQNGITNAPNQTGKTIYKIDVSTRSDYVFSASLKKGAKGAPKVYLAWDEKGERKIKGAEFTGETDSFAMYSSRIITDFGGAVYLVVEGGGEGSSNYFAFFPTKFGFEEDPNPYYVRPEVDYNKLPSRPADELLMPYNKLEF